MLAGLAGLAGLGGLAGLAGLGGLAGNLFRRDLGRVEEWRAGTEATPPFLPPRSLMEI